MRRRADIAARRLGVGVALFLCLAVSARAETIANGGAQVFGSNASGGNLSIFSTTNGTKGKVLLGSAGTSAYDEVNDRFGIGIATPTRKLHVVDGTAFELQAGSASVISFNYGTSTSADALWLAQARGVLGGATAISSGDQMGGLNFVGHDGSAFSVGARILGQASATWGTGGSDEHGAEMRFFTRATGTSGALTLRGRFTAAGDWIVSSSGAGVARDLEVVNTDNASTNSHARFLAQAGGTAGGDPYIRFNIPSGTTADWSVGSDNADLDKFKISRASVPGTNDALTIDSTNNVTITTLNGATVSVLVGEANSFAHANLGGAM